MMQTRLKIVLAFLPLVLIFLVLFFLVPDIQNPGEDWDTCTIVATGPKATPYRKNSTVIYQHSKDSIHDVALQCRTLGSLVFNDLQRHLTPVEKGQSVSLRVLTYKYLPKRWTVNVTTNTEKNSQTSG
ncbi:MAG: hypothetical protein AAGI66_01470 [Cyanobacteria bacterium P01_H01_bin.74]